MALIKRVREGQTYYLFPGGGVEPGETAEQAAIREAREELGVDVRLQGVLYEEAYTGVPFVYFAAQIVGGEFGTGAWPDHERRDQLAREKSGTHEPVWLPLEQLADVQVGLDVRPTELVRMLVARG